MQRLLTLFCAAAILAGPLGLAGEASARDRDAPRREQPHRAEGMARGRGEAQRNWRGRDDVRESRPRGEARERVYRDEPRAPYPAPPAYYGQAPRRGGYMPPQAGGEVPDYGRYRLRPPPPGYSWVRTGNGYAMVRGDTGQVFDIVPY